MKKRISSVILASCVLFLISCSPMVSAQIAPTKIADFNSKLSYYTFPKTDWGMTPQEVMKAWGLSIDDVVITPQNISDTELGIKLTVTKPLEIIGESVTNVSFVFDYLRFFTGDGYGYGLTVASVDFNYDAFGKVQKALDETFTDETVTSNLNTSKGTFDTLPAEKQASILKVLSNYTDAKGPNSLPDFTSPNKFPEKNALSSCEMIQLKEKPYSVRVKYYGKISAMANTDFDKILQSMNESKKSRGIDE